LDPPFSGIKHVEGNNHRFETYDVKMTKTIEEPSYQACAPVVASFFSTNELRADLNSGKRVTSGLMDEIYEELFNGKRSARSNDNR